MPFKIQRVPRGLNDLLSIAGGTSPLQLADQVAPTLELLQFYGLQQRMLLAANDAALAEGSSVSVTVTSWAVLFGAAATVIKTATATALRASILLNRSGSGAANSQLPVASNDLGPFGATESGATTVPFIPPYPLLLPPGSIIRANLQILGTDATANVTIQAEIGLLG